MSSPLTHLDEAFQKSWGYRSGNWSPLSQIHWSLSDQGPMHGAIVVERLRTFDGKIFFLERHAQRFARGAEALQIPMENSFGNHNTFSNLLFELIERNKKLLETAGDVGIVVLLSPGDGGWGGSQPLTPTLIAHLVPIPWKKLTNWYERGAKLWWSETRNIPASCWPPSLKTRSRLHYYRADREAQRHSPESIGVLLNQKGCITETSVANLVLVDAQKKVRSPRLEDVLPGVSLDNLCQILGKLQIDIAFEDLSPLDLESAHEVWMVGTTGAIWPAVTIGDSNIGEGCPGSMYRQVSEAWKELVQFDFQAHARRLASKD